MTNKLTAIAVLMVEVMIDEMGVLRNIESISGPDGFGAEFQRERLRNLHDCRASLEALAAGYAGADSDNRDGEPRTGEQVTSAPHESVIEDLIAEMLGKGITVQKINIADLIGKPDPVAPPAENKAERAAYEAAKRAGEANG